MDGDIGAMLQSVLSDPEQMAQITRMAQGLMQAQPAPSAPPQEVGSPPPAAGGQTSFSEGEAKLLSSLGSLFSQNGGKSRSTALLVAMRPYMKPEKQEKLDRAMKLAQMFHIVSAVMQQLGGGHGL